MMIGVMKMPDYEIEHTAKIIGLLGASANGTELCRRLASDDVFGPGTIGVQLYALTNVGNWTLLGSFGKSAFGNQKLTQFDENVLNLAARSRKIETVELEVDSKLAEVTVCVLLRNDIPVGMWVRVTTPGTYIFRPILLALRAIQDAGGLFMDAIGFRAVAASERVNEASPEDMTERQMAILIEMAHGKTNIVIAREMILSESTIKQESVKIFRAIGVGTRQQAVLKARALGLLPEGIEVGG
jgi:DNA-binding CsgD family transcriptional regulator